MEHLAIVGVVCLTLLAALVLVLRHLSASRVTKSQASDLQREFLNLSNMHSADIAKLRADLDNEKAKLTQLANRVR